MKKFTADFETATWLENETYVWAWAISEIGNEENLIIDNNIESFIEFCKSQKNSTFYFHNLKFDGEFIIYYLLTHNFKHVEKKEEIADNTFTTLISNMGQFYNIVVYFKKGNKKVHKVTFIDSLKIIPFSVDETAKAFNLPISKLKIDYNEPRKIGHILTDEEKNYIKNDVQIMSKALKITFDEGLDRMTRASSALKDYKEIVGKSRFEHCFPVLTKELDAELRHSYKGGFTYLNPIYKEKDVKNIVNLDVNSLYPFVMYDRSLPFDEPKYYKGKYKEDKIYNLYIQRITCSFEIKKNKIPTIQIKNNHSFFMANEYLESSDNQIVCLTLTNIDLKLFLEQYNVYYLNYVEGWKFKSMKGLFTDYIDKWISKKIQATIDKNKGLRTTSKLMLNSLYGKYATSLECQSKVPYLENDVVRYAITPKEEKKGLYLPVASFITAYAREITIRTSQAIKEYSLKKYGQDMYIYSDTDSIKTLLPVEELEQFCNIDDVALGAWKNEGIATKGKWIRQKCYLEEIDGKMHTCAGMPKSCYDRVEWDKFKTGFTCGGKLTFKHVKGGVKLVETEFTIKDYKFRKNIDKFDKK